MTAARRPPGGRPQRWVQTGGLLEPVPFREPRRSSWAPAPPYQLWPPSLLLAGCSGGSGGSATPVTTTETTTATLDHDGAPDELWIDDAADGRRLLGVRTAPGAVFSTAFDPASPRG